MDTQQIDERLNRIEILLQALLGRQMVKEFYTPAEVATILGKAEFTVREWCRDGRIHAQKRRSGRGRHKEWVISHEELLRFQAEGLLPRKHLVNGTT